MQSFYDLQALADQQVEQRRAEAYRERLLSEARYSHAVSTSGEVSESRTGRLGRLRSQLRRGLSLSLHKPAPSTT